ncbi:MAG TPA: RNA pyrophosphohydrolase [Kiloniellaceae bacterium]|nr:RNA pyrophosphohydrolase [Kiloniellaceae bacterium]
MPSDATQNTSLADLPYRPGVGILLLNSDGKVFVGRRIDTTAEAWQLPQGGIDPGETPRDAALRELEEETGTNLVEVLAESRDWLTYDLPAEIAGKVWGGRFRGQRQKWFAMRFLGEDGNIDIETDHPEFNAWRWADLNEVPAQIVDFKRPLYEALLEEFRDLVANYS